MKTKILKSHKSKTSKTKTSKSKTSKSKKSKTKSSKFIHNAIKHKEIKRKISRKELRKYEIDRVKQITKIIPLFTKFYNKFTNDELIALKFYYVHGSYWQTKFLTNEKQPREIKFPFHIYEEQSFRRDVFGPNSKKYPMLKSFDIKDIPNYIKHNYQARIKILNDLDSIYNKPTCPRLSGNEILFRGMTLPKTFKKYKEGDTFTFKNFISTSVYKQVGENFSNGSLFILQDLKNIPFLYMPDDDIDKDKGIEYTKQMGNLNPMYDGTSEYTLPRNLEFKIDKIEDGFMSSIYYKQKIPSFTKLTKLLKNKGILNKNTKNTKKTKKTKNTKKNNQKSNTSNANVINNTKTNSNNNNTNTNTNSNNNNNNNSNNNKNNTIIEKEIFPKVKIYYCSFTKWHPREPLNYDTIMKDAKYVLDEYALSSWNLKQTDLL